MPNNNPYRTSPRTLPTYPPSRTQGRYAPLPSWNYGRGYQDDDDESLASRARRSRKEPEPRPPLTFHEVHNEVRALVYDCDRHRDIAKDRNRFVRRLVRDACPGKLFDADVVEKIIQATRKAVVDGAAEQHPVKRTDVLYKRASELFNLLGKRPR